VKIRDVCDNHGRAFALRAKLRLHVIEATRMMLRGAPAMCRVHNATRDA